jgi:hypothetical protein
MFQIQGAQCREKNGFYKLVPKQLFSGLLDTIPDILLLNLVPLAIPSYSAKTE